MDSLINEFSRVSTKKAVMFDVFDTIVMRQVRRLGDQFVDLYSHLPSRLQSLFSDAQTFRLERIQAEERARSGKKGREVNLDLIWRQLLGPHFADLSLVGRISEEAYEANTLVLDRDVQKLLEECQRAGLIVAAVSDTYFSSQFLHRLFTSRFKLEIARENIFCSNEFDVSKSAGLWKTAVSKLGMEPEEVQIFGDNYQADVEAPSTLGITSTLLPNGTSGLWRTFQVEEELAPPRISESELRDYGISSVRSRIARNYFLEPTSTKYEELGGAILGPVFTGYAHWVASQLRSHGDTHFVALKREGGFLASLISSTFPGDLSYRELKVSRRSLVLPSIFEASTRELSDILARLPQVSTVDEIARMLHLTDVDLKDSMAAKVHSKDEFLELIGNSEKLKSRVLQHANTSRVGFFKEFERALELINPTSWPEHLHLIDLGWGGTIPHMISRILTKSGIKIRINAYFLAKSLSLVPENSRHVKVLGFLDPQSRDLFFECAGVLEQICSDHSPPTIEYSQDGPVLGQISTPRHQMSQAELVRKGIQMFQRLTQKLNLDQSIPWISFSIRSQLSSILDRFLLDPSPDERSLFAGWTHDDTSRMGIQTPLVSTLIYGDFADFVNPVQLRKILPSNNFWPSANRKLLHSSVEGHKSISSDQFRVQVFGANDQTLLFDETIEMFNHSVFAVVEFESPLRGSLRIDPTDRPSIISNLSIAAWHADQSGAEIESITSLSVTHVENMFLLRDLIYLTNDDPRIYVRIPEIVFGKFKLLIAFNGANLREVAPASTNRFRRLLNSYRAVRTIGELLQ